MEPEFEYAAQTLEVERGLLVYALRRLEEQARIKGPEDSREFMVGMARQKILSMDKAIAYLREKPVYDEFGNEITKPTPGETTP